MNEKERFLAEVRDRAAYVYIAGFFPSHLRVTYTDVIRQVMRPYRKPPGLDGRVGNMVLDKRVVAHLKLDKHRMVQAVRSKITQGNLIQPSRGHETRRNFGKVFLFRLMASGSQHDFVTINLDGTIKGGW